MEQTNIEISDEQARLLARCIYEDISSYIKSHQEEYEKFLKKYHGGTTDEKENPATY